MDEFLAWLTKDAQPDLDWNYALVTLVFRFFAVFVVLWMIQVGMQLSARIIRRIEEKEAGGGPDTAAPPAPATAATSDDSSSSELDAKTAAAIGIALELDSQPEAVRVEDRRGPSAWSIAGRVNQLRKR